MYIRSFDNGLIYMYTHIYIYICISNYLVHSNDVDSRVLLETLTLGPGAQARRAWGVEHVPRGGTVGP